MPFDLSGLLNQFRHKSTPMEQRLPQDYQKMSGVDYANLVDRTGRGAGPHFNSGLSGDDFHQQRESYKQSRMNQFGGGGPITPVLISKLVQDIHDPKWMASHPVQAVKAQQLWKELSSLYLNQQ